MDAEENGGDYDDDGFEDYSDEFDGEDDDPPPPTPKPAAAATGTAAVTRPVSARGGGGGGGGAAVVSSAIKIKKTGDVQAADDKVACRAYCSVSVFSSSAV